MENNNNVRCEKRCKNEKRTAKNTKSKIMYQKSQKNFELTHNS